jgi:pimeloyl-ACP methyl ester carboxylesterase
VQKQALRDGDYDVLVGSSWGGAVAAALLADGSWDGPTVLLCPALRHKERWLDEPFKREHTADTIIARLAALPAPLRAMMLLVHGDADRTVPFSDSSELSVATGIALQAIEGGSHGLSAIVRDGRLAQILRRVAALQSDTVQSKVIK